MWPSAGAGEWGRESRREGNPSVGACRPSPCSSLGRIRTDTPLRLLFQLLIVEKRMRLRTGHDVGNVGIDLAGLARAGPAHFRVLPTGGLLLTFFDERLLAGALGLRRARAIDHGPPRGACRRNLRGPVCMSGPRHSFAAPG